MRQPMRLSVVTSWLLLTWVCAACDGDRPQPVAPATIPQPPAPAPAPAPAVHVVAVDIAGPESIPPGRSIQFSATVRFSDGSREPLTNHKWVFSNELVHVDATGLATAGQQNGEGILRVRVTTPSGFVDGIKTILVLPERTYRVVGVVTEEESPDIRVVGARVEVTGDSRVAALTDFDGTYRLYGVATGAEVRVTRNGYRTHAETLDVADHASRNFQLALAGARLDFSGSYTLAIDAECNTSTPVRPTDLRHRSYAAVLTQAGSVIDVVLTESSRFRVNAARRGDRFKGHADAGGATFVLQSFFSYYPLYDASTYPDLLERIPDGTFLQIDGTAVTRTTPAGLTGELNGFFAHYSSGFPQVAPGAGGTLGTCWGSGTSAHRFTLTRR